MSSTNFLTSKQFWLFFTIAVILSLYFYGVKIVGDKTEIAQTKKALAQANADLARCNQANETKNTKIQQLNSDLERQNNTITESNNLITSLNDSIYKLNDSIYKLANRPPQIFTEYQDKIIFKDRPETYHAYGKGNGKLVIYTTCGDGGKTSVWVDGVYLGSLDSYHKSSVNCNSSGTVFKVVLSGSHHVTGKDQANRNWDGYIVVSEDECQTYGLTCK